MSNSDNNSNNNESSKDENEENVEEEITEEFVEVVKNWVKIDDEIRTKTSEIKDLKDEKKEYELFILEFMQKNHENVINISDGKLRVNKSTSKAGLKQESIQSSLFDLTRDPNKALQMTKYILDNRPVTERVNLKRTKHRPSKKNKGKDKDI